jgi:ribosome-binding factor A
MYPYQRYYLKNLVKSKYNDKKYEDVLKHIQTLCDNNLDISEFKHEHKESLKFLMYQNYYLFQIPDFLYYYDSFIKNGFEIDLNLKIIF